MSLQKQENFADFPSFMGVWEVENINQNFIEKRAAITLALYSNHNAYLEDPKANVIRRHPTAVIISGDDFDVIFTMGKNHDQVSNEIDSFIINYREFGEDIGYFSDAVIIH